MTYEIRYSDGRTEQCDTYEQAVEVLEAECDVVGHSGDLSEGGDRTLAWRTEDDAGDEGSGDDGARAYASICRR